MYSLELDFLQYNRYASSLLEPTPIRYSPSLFDSVAGIIYTFPSFSSMFNKNEDEKSKFV